MPRHPAGLVPRRIAPGYTADRSVNFGDVVTIAGNEIKQLCRVSLEHASMMTLVVSCDAIEVPAQLMTAFSYRPMVRVSWGNGNMSLQADYDVTVRRSVPLPASYIDVQVWICPLPYPGANVPIGPPLLDGPSTRPTTADATVTAKFSGYIADGQALDEFPSIWLTQFDTNAAQFVIGQVRPLSIASWLYATSEGSPTIYLLIFDKATLPVNGDLPVNGTPLPMNVRVNIPMGTTEPLVYGLAWALSTTADRLTLAVGAQAFVLAEIRT